MYARPLSVLTPHHRLLSGIRQIVFASCTLTSGSGQWHDSCDHILSLNAAEGNQAISTYY
jgi:hypothetical protein